MVNAYISTIEEQLNETIERHQLMAETNRSYIYHMIGKRQYVLKQSKRVSLVQQFECHKQVFDLWQRQKKHCIFRIPEPYLSSRDGKFMLMEYVNGDSLLKGLVSGDDKIENVFRQAGQGLQQYHALVTEAFFNQKEDLSRYEYIADVLSKTGGHVIRQRLSEFPDESKRVLFKDFSPANVVVSQSGEIYFLDVQEAFYFGPLYYDLSRFIDTTKVFSIVKNPFVVFNYARVRQVVQAFLEGYNEAIDFDLLKKMQFVHRKEHIHIKMTVKPISAIILKLLYGVL